MPSRNIIKKYQPNTFIHIYNRGVNKQTTFYDEQDMRVFLDIIDRYLNPDTDQLDSNKLAYQKFSQIELAAYCLMGNHYHLMLHLGDEPAQMPAFMKALSNSYTSYFNRKNNRIGPLFQGTYKGVAMESDEQLAHTIRYIHLNPEDYLNYQFSSVRIYLGGQCPPWLSPQRAIDLMCCDNYLTFLKSA